MTVENESDEIFSFQFDIVLMKKKIPFQGKTIGNAFGESSSEVDDWKKI